jgi:uncharacterized protein (DUF433 family)
MSALPSTMLSFLPDPVPLRAEADGTIRVGNSRITLDILIEEFVAGATAEGIAAEYDTLDRADIYAILAYYLHHKDEIQSYLRRREQEATEITRKLELAGMTWPEAGRVLRSRLSRPDSAPNAKPLN